MRTTNHVARTSQHDSTINTNKMSTVHVVLTGGIGSRLWPLSRRSQPKQYLPLFAGKSLFGLTVERNCTIADQVMVVGNRDNNHLSKQVMEESALPYINIVEATPRNTAAAIAFAAFAAESEDVLIVTPSDHIITGIEAYEWAIQQGIQKAQEGFIVTFGIQPSRPETGYGYIEYSGDEVISFREKPNKETAEDFIEKGNFLWNSGMFCFKAAVFLEELQRYQPKVYNSTLIAWEAQQEGCLDESLSLAIPAISVDYAVMERSKKIRVVPTAFHWSDLGSFEALYDYLKESGYPTDERGNMVIGTEQFTGFVGLSNTIFVATDDAFLILQKENSQDVKKIFSLLEKHQSKLLD